MKIYYIKQRISLDDKYYVYDANDELYLEIESKNKLLTYMDRLFGGIFTCGNKIYLKYLDGKEIMTIKKKCGIFREVYDLYNKDSKVASFRKYIVSLKPKISITAENDSYSIKGDFMARNFVIYKNGKGIAQIQKFRFKLTDSYKISIYEDADEFICISFLIAIDNSIHN